MSDSSPSWTVVITMAGESSRFRRAGYDRPKHELFARGRSLLEWSVGSLRSFIPVTRQWIFVTRSDHAKAPIIDLARNLKLEAPTLLELDEVTDGQATTVMRGLDIQRDPATRVLVFNIDTHIEAQTLHPRMIRGTGWLGCFRAPGVHWSFARVEDDGRVLEVREKQRISDHCSLGLYDFESRELFAHAYAETYLRGRDTGVKERYIAPMYEYLLRQGLPVYADLIPSAAVIPLGTPAELLSFDPLATPAA